MNILELRCEYDCDTLLIVDHDEIVEVCSLFGVDNDTASDINACFAVYQDGECVELFCTEDSLTESTINVEFEPVDYWLN